MAVIIEVASATAEPYWRSASSSCITSACGEGRASWGREAPPNMALHSTGRRQQGCATLHTGANSSAMKAGDAAYTRRRVPVAKDLAGQPAGGPCTAFGALVPSNHVQAGPQQWQQAAQQPG